MNKSSLPIFAVVLLATLFSNPIFSQEYFASVESSVSTERIADVYRLDKRLPAFHTGYVIEVATSTFPIERDHPVFKRFGKILYHKLKEGGYSYVIKADFSDLKSAQNFCETVIKPHVNEARVFEYKKGERKLKD